MCMLNPRTRRVLCLCEADDPSLRYYLTRTWGFVTLDINKMLWDVFISHASEDKEEVARPLAQRLEQFGLRVWFDEQQLRVGDKLSQKINEGLAFSRYGIVILSPSFLGKDYPQKELQALLSRETSQGGYILPILHGIEHERIRRELPLIADNVAISTARGLDAVAEAVAKVAAVDRTGTLRPATVRYFRNFAFPATLLERSLDSIEALRLEATWVHLESKRDMKDPSVWMGTDSSLLVSILFNLYAPLMLFRKLSYSLKRSLSTLERTDRIRFGLLEAAYYALTNEGELAASRPTLEYTPRVAQWRLKRAEQPARYWWQGLSTERVDEVLPYFLESGPDEFSSKVVELPEFSSSYARAYASSGRVQQPLGLLANALYGFRPLTRPVYWRLLRIWEICYKELLAANENTALDSGESLVTRNCLISDIDEVDLFESTAVTNQAAAEFIDLFVLARLRVYRDRMVSEMDA
jgi:TIR domain